MHGQESRIVVAGAGSIGCYAGGCLALAGRRVTLLARPRLVAAILQAGLRVSDIEGRDRLARPDGLNLTADPAALSSADVVLVTVKCGATAEMASLIAAHAPVRAVVVSLQNGVGNADALRHALPGRRVLAGMVPFNVVQSREGELPLKVHRASGGKVLIEDAVVGLARLLDVQGFEVETHADMAAVLWGKLLMNLNNALVALSGLPLATELADRRWRLILAAQIDEALVAMKAANIHPARIAGLRPALLPYLLRLPDWAFRRVARRLLAIDPEARSSMWDDLERRRPTEIDELQGAVLSLSKRTGVPAPVTCRVADLVREAEMDGRGPPGLSPDAIAIRAVG